MLGYLRRLALNNQHLDDDLRFEGVIFNPQNGELRVVVSQPFIIGRPATRAEIEAYFKAKGFERFTNRSWWHGGYEILFSDAEGHNILTGVDGRVYPIDLIPEIGLSPMRIQQIERGVEGFKSIQEDTIEPGP